MFSPLTVLLTLLSFIAGAASQLYDTPLLPDDIFKNLPPVTADDLTRCMVPFAQHQGKLIVCIVKSLFVVARFLCACLVVVVLFCALFCLSQILTQFSRALLGYACLNSSFARA
jgi:hypothetical protein